MFYRNLWGIAKREELTESLPDPGLQERYSIAMPSAENRYAFVPRAAAREYPSWTALPDLATLEPFSGVLEMRRGSLMGWAREEVEARIRRYFDPQVPISELRNSRSGPAEDMARFDAAKARDRALREGSFVQENVKQVVLRPFDTVWAYHTNIRPLWNEPRPELVSRSFPGNGFVVTRFRSRRPGEGHPIYWTRQIPGYHLLDPNCHPFPLLDSPRRANLSAGARRWLQGLALPDPDADRELAAAPWRHALAIGYAPAWLHENGEAIRQGWPRIPLPNSADLLRHSAALGARVAALLDPEQAVAGVTEGAIAAALSCIAVPVKAGGGAISEADRALTAGWGHTGKGGAVMPGRGRIVTRDYDTNEAATQAQAGLLGARTHDVFLNADAYWRNVPQQVWEFSIGGYQVLKKFLSYRERPLLGRPLSPGEVRYVRDIARRLAALLLLGPELDANYRACAAAHSPLPKL